MTEMKRRAWLALSGLSLALTLGSAWAFPTKPIRVVMGFPAGGPLDQHARLLTDRLQAQLGQPILVDYKAGAGDFVPVARTAMQPLALMVNPKVPVNTLQEFVAYAKDRPGQINYGSAGNGGSSHLVPEMFKTATGLFMVHIPYRGSAPAFTDLMAGQVQFMAESIPQAAQYHKQGKVRALAVTSRERNPALPDIPTVMETGIKNFEVVGFYGFLAPAGTPKDVVTKLSDAFKAVMNQPDIRQRMVAQGADPAYLGADDFAKFLTAELPRWAAVVQKSGAKLD
jgi:tripartite-type tricarboxylate transporter receptor subunit TctC